MNCLWCNQYVHCIFTLVLKTKHTLYHILHLRDFICRKKYNRLCYSQTYPWQPEVGRALTVPVQMLRLVKECFSLVPNWRTIYLMKQNSGTNYSLVTYIEASPTRSPQKLLFINICDSMETLLYLIHSIFMQFAAQFGQPKSTSSWKQNSFF